MHAIAVRFTIMMLVAFAALPAHGEALYGDGPINETRDLVRKEFYDPKGLADFEDVLKAPRDPQLTKRQITEIIDTALRALKASHTGRYTSEQIEYYELMHIFQSGVPQKAMREIFPSGIPQYSGIGIVPRVIEGKTFVLHVYHGTPADRAGIKSGDEIISVDGKPYEPIGSFRGGGAASVQIRRVANSGPISIEVPINSIRPGDMFRDAIRSSARVIEQDGKRVGYVRVWTYATRGVHSLLIDLLSSEPLRSADALVLDLRSRWGGAPPEASELIVGRSPDMILVDPQGKQNVASVRWRKPVVALIDEGTRSGMEIFAYALKQNGIKLIGTRSAGAVLVGRGFLLEDDSLLVLAIRDVLIDGQKLEGVGVTPDIEVARDIRYSGGADPVLERGLKEVTEILRKRS